MGGNVQQSWQQSENHESIQDMSVLRSKRRTLSELKEQYRNEFPEAPMPSDAALRERYSILHASIASLHHASKSNLDTSMQSSLHASSLQASSLHESSLQTSSLQASSLQITSLQVSPSKSSQDSGGTVENISYVVN